MDRLARLVVGSDSASATLVRMRPRSRYASDLSSACRLEAISVAETGAVSLSASSGTDGTCGELTPLASSWKCSGRYSDLSVSNGEGGRAVPAFGGE